MAMLLCRRVSFYRTEADSTKICLKWHLSLPNKWQLHWKIPFRPQTIFQRFEKKLVTLPFSQWHTWVCPNKNDIPSPLKQLFLLCCHHHHERVRNMEIKVWATPAADESSNDWLSFLMFFVGFYTLKVDLQNAITFQVSHFKVGFVWKI